MNKSIYLYAILSLTLTPNAFSSELNEVDSCIFTKCESIPLVNLRSEYVEAEYYLNANKPHQNSKSLRDSVNIDIKKNHIKLNYNQVWTAMLITDEDPYNSENVILLYTGKSIAKNKNSSLILNRNNQDAWNREHVWSKSHGFKKESQFGFTDLHHLKPADASINTLKSNNDFDNGGYSVQDGDIVTDNNLVKNVSWEPRSEIKGDVARMMFYMDIRYESEDENMPDLILVDRVNTYSKEKEINNEYGKLCTLYEWHQNDLVDTQEIKRNNDIYEFQGNRNPFIDHPEWVEKIYGSKCDEGKELLPIVSVDLSNVKEGESITIKAKVNKNDLSFLWSQESGFPVTLTGNKTSQVEFTAPYVNSSQYITLSVVVEDEAGNKSEAKALVKIIKNKESSIDLMNNSNTGGSTGIYSLLILIFISIRKMYR
jgi:endonuclease I